MIIRYLIIPSHFLILWFTAAFIPMLTDRISKTMRTFILKAAIKRFSTMPTLRTFVVALTPIPMDSHGHALRSPGPIVIGMKARTQFGCSIGSAEAF